MSAPSRANGVSPPDLATSASRFLRKPRGRGGADRDAGRRTAELEAELLMLREENARLKARPHRASAAEDLLAHLRAAVEYPDPSGHRDGDGDDATLQAVVEGMVVRETLLDICSDIDRCMHDMLRRLRALELSDDLLENG